MKVDKKDKKILYSLSKDMRSSAASIGRKCGLNKNTVVYRISRLFDSGIVKRCIGLVNTQGLGFTRHEVFIQLKNANEDKEREISEFIAKNPMFLWVRCSLGNYDILTEFYSKNSEDYEKTISEIRNAFGQFIKRMDSAIVLVEYSFPLKLLGEVDEERVETSPVKIDVDKKDLIIMKDLANDARVPVVNISKKVRLSPDAVAYRIRELIKKNIIFGYRVVVDEKLLGFQKYKILLRLRNVDEKTSLRVLDIIKSNSSTQYIKRCIGNWDFSVTLLAEDIYQFRKIILDIKSSLKDVLEDCIPLVLFEEHKNTYFPQGIL